MTLMLAGMVFSVVVGMVLRKHELGMRIMVLLTAIGLTVMYLIFSNRFM
jgi:hypothetical protein